MKNLVLFITVLFFDISSYSQNTQLPKTETKGNLQEVTIYYENGAIMQHGFYTKEGKLHGSWESYNSDGSKKCFATYNYGLKVGVWTYWNMHKITKIEYDNDNILKIEEINIREQDKNNY